MDLAEYLAGPFRTIQGWCDAGLWRTVESVLAFQTEHGIAGPVAEIGVHHGKFFIGLVLAKNHPGGNLAIDVFGDQEFNLDASGRGDAEVFLGHLGECGINRSAVDLRQVDSSIVTDAEIDAIRAQTGGFTLFSVDGSHRVEHTLNDIRLAMKLTQPGGVILIDDYLNPDWPGVGEAVARLYLFDAPLFVPFAFTTNKLLLCHLRHHRDYLDGTRDFLRAKHKNTRIKKVMRFGYKTLAIHPSAEEGPTNVDGAEPIL